MIRHRGVLRERKWIVRSDSEQGNRQKKDSKQKDGAAIIAMMLVTACSHHIDDVSGCIRPSETVLVTGDCVRPLYRRCWRLHTAITVRKLVTGDCMQSS